MRSTRPDDIRHRRRFSKTFDDLSIGKKLLFRSWRAAISWTSAEAGPAATTLTAMAAITAE